MRIYGSVHYWPKTINGIKTSKISENYLYLYLCVFNYIQKTQFQKKNQKKYILAVSVHQPALNQGPHAHEPDALQLRHNFAAMQLRFEHALISAKSPSFKILKLQL